MILHADLFDALPTLAPDSIDSCVCDPPYDLTSNKAGGSGDASINLDSPYGRARIGTGNGPGGFMGKKWDGTGVAFRVETWREVYRVLKPGAYLLAFGGTRTYHRMALAIENAGFEIRDCIGEWHALYPDIEQFMQTLDDAQTDAFIRIMDQLTTVGTISWEFGSGFPKSLDVSKAIDEAAGAERKIIGVRPIAYPDSPSGYTSVSQNSTARGGGIWNPVTGETEHGRPVTGPVTDEAKRWQGFGTSLKPAFEPIVCARKPLMQSAINVVNIVESNLRARGVKGEIQWTNDVNAAVKKKKTQTSLLIQPPSMAETSVKRVSEFEIPNIERNIDKEYVTTSNDGVPLIQKNTEDMHVNMTHDYDWKSSMRTEGSAPVAENQNSASLKEVDQPTDGLFEKSMLRSNETRFPPTIEYFAGIVTGLTGSWETVRIKRNFNGTFEWPDGLPNHVAAQPLTVASNILTHGTGGLNIDACRIASPDADPDAMQHCQTQQDGATVTLNVHSQPTYNKGGRWPANVVLSHTPDCVQTGVHKVKSSNAHFVNTETGSEKPAQVYGKFKRTDEGTIGHADVDGTETVEKWACHPECPVRLLDEQTGQLTSGKPSPFGHTRNVSLDYQSNVNYADRSKDAGYLFGDSGGASRFFKTFSADKIDAIDTVFHRARALLTTWKLKTANFAGLNLHAKSDLEKEVVASVLNDVVVLLTAGSMQIKPDSTELSTSVTTSECVTLCETLIITILSLGDESLLASLQEKPILNKCRVKVAATKKPIDITTIMISHWKSDGSAEPVTLSITSVSMDHGEKVLANRFMYCAKPSREERDQGCYDLPARSGGEATDRQDNTAGVDNPRAGAGRTGGARNIHPTCKPVTLMHWLIKLVTPPRGTVLDPFLGSGTTGMAARYGDFDFIGVERELEYVEIARRRVSSANPLVFGEEQVKVVQPGTTYTEPEPSQASEPARTGPEPDKNPVPAPALTERSLTAKAKLDKIRARLLGKG